MVIPNVTVVCLRVFSLYRKHRDAIVRNQTRRNIILVDSSGHKFTQVLTNI